MTYRDNDYPRPLDRILSDREPDPRQYWREEHDAWDREQANLRQLRTKGE